MRIKHYGVMHCPETTILEIDGVKHYFHSEKELKNFFLENEDKEELVDYYLKNFYKPKPRKRIDVNIMDGLIEVMLEKEKDGLKAANLLDDLSWNI